MSLNEEVQLTLDEAVQEVLSFLTGLDMTYLPEMDRYRTTARNLNRALRANALEQEWSYYASTECLGQAAAGQSSVRLRRSLRPRIISDDSVQLYSPENKRAEIWAYALPRDALSKYGDRKGLWYAVTRDELKFSRPLSRAESRLHIHVPAMREPIMFRLPPAPENPQQSVSPVPEEIRRQTIDFDYPDVVIMRAAFMMAQSDPVYQPRVQTIEEQYKDLMYQLIERDIRHTDSPFQNEFILPISNSIETTLRPRLHGHPHSDDRTW